jgi:hypothetical protein
MRARGAGFVVMVALLVGCGGQEEPGEEQPPSSGGLDPNAVAPPPASNGACNDVAGSGISVMDQRSMSVPPLTGGTMTDGRYVLTRYEWYTANTLHTRSIVLVISGGGRFGQYLWQRNQEPEERMTVAITTQGERVSMTATCPAGQSLEWDNYSVNDAGLTLFSTRDSKAAFFSRQ